MSYRLHLSMGDSVTIPLLALVACSFSYVRCERSDSTKWLANAQSRPNQVVKMSVPVTICSPNLEDSIHDSIMLSSGYFLGAVDAKA